MPRFNVGDTIYYVESERTTKRVTCPDCFGKLALTVILGDNSQVSIACTGCSAGFNPPRGTVEEYIWNATIKKGTVGGMEILGEKISYKVNIIWFGDDGTVGHSYRTVESNEAFASVEEATPAIVAIVAKHNEDEAQRLQMKKEPIRTWAWHVTYYRGLIRDAEKTLERAMAALNVAQAKKAETPKV